MLMRTLLRDVKISETVRVAIDALGGDQATITGKVVQIVPAADPASRSFMVKVELPAQQTSTRDCSGEHISRGERANRCSCRRPP